jgi:hypothetical protein
MEIHDDGVEFITGDFDALIDEAVSKHGELLKRLADDDSLDTARAAYVNADGLQYGGGRDIFVRKSAADALIAALEAAIIAKVERMRVISNERELLLRYGRAMLADMTKEGLSTISMQQMQAMLDKEDADEA